LFEAAVCAGMTFSLLLYAQPIQAEPQSGEEHRSKASFLSKFPLFVEWPEGALPSAGAPFLICVFGDFSFGASLAETTRRTTVHDKRVEARWVHKEQELLACQIVFVSQSERKRYNRILEALREQAVLSVGETPEFLDAGGMLTLSMQQGTLQFDANLAGANRSHLKMRSQLPALARHVVNQPEAAKI
jgi:YfiR/HmsC-like